MGRGRVELKKIENKISRQVTFSKRRTGLLKKAREISVLCDATVALFVFSTKGKLCEFASDSACMEKILERYEQYSQAERDLTTTPNPNSHGSLTLEHAKLQAKLDILHKKHRNYMGEELDTLSCKELQNVEHRLDIALKHIRSKKNQLMYESISELQKKEKALEENNNNLSKKMKEKQNMKEKEKAIDQQSQCDKQNHIPNSSSFFASQILPSLNMRGSYESGGSVVEDEATQSQHRGSSSTIMPAWMLSHIANK